MMITTTKQLQLRQQLDNATEKSILQKRNNRYSAIVVQHKTLDLYVLLYHYIGNVFILLRSTSVSSLNGLLLYTSS